MKKLLVTLWLLLASVFGFCQNQKPSLVYIIDPLCSWCYTFNPIAEKLHAKYQHKLDFVVISGGMITGKRVRPIADMAEYILAGYADMQNLTGIKFGEKYLQMVHQGTELLDSEKPSNALVAFKQLVPEKAMSFEHDLQNLYFGDGYSLNQDSTYLKLAAKYHLDGASFLLKMKSDTIKTLTKQDFKKVDDAGITGFPTLLLQINGKVILITEGFEKLEKIEKKINKELKDNNG